VSLSSRPISRFISLFALFFCLRAAGAERPLAPEAPLAISTLSLNGGGGSALEGVAGLYHNPATLIWRGGAQAELGMVDMTQGMSPYALVGYQTPNGPTGALGAFRHMMEDGNAYEGLATGFSWGLGADARLGMAMTGSFAKGEFGIDGHAGLWSSFAEHAEVGLWARNIMASGLGEPPAGLETEREIGLATGLHFESFGIWRLHLHDIGLGYDLTARRFSPQDWRHTVSGRVWLPPHGSIGLLSGATLDGKEPVPTVSYGLGIKLPLGGGSLQCHYVLMPGHSAAGGDPETRHSIALHYEVGGQIDVLPPKVAAVASPARSPIDSVARFGIYFHLTAEDPDGQIKEWELLLSQADSTGRLGTAVMRYHGKGLPPRFIRWMGEDAESQRVAPGLYGYRFEAGDRSGHVAATPPGMVELSPVPP